MEKKRTEKIGKAVDSGVKGTSQICYVQAFVKQT
jgi:hypothetical protein